jgi:hypothetical protein
MADQPSPRRRFQFRLRTLMIVVTLLAVPCAYVGWQAKIVRERRETAEWIGKTLGGTTYRYDDDLMFVKSYRRFRPPLLRRLFGDWAYYRVVVPHPSEADLKRIREVFPGVEIVQGVYDGPP